VRAASHPQLAGYSFWLFFDLQIKNFPFGVLFSFGIIALSVNLLDLS